MGVFLAVFLKQRNEILQNGVALVVLRSGREVGSVQNNGVGLSVGDQGVAVAVHDFASGGLNGDLVGLDRIVLGGVVFVIPNLDFI